MNDAKLLFAGTPEFALPSLRALVESGRAPVAVLTQPDRPAGRGKKLTASPIKEYAVAQGIPVWQPVTLKDPQIVDDLRRLEPDLLIVVAYGLLLPGAVLAIPGQGCLNVHASLLPRWRGAAPIQQAILTGDDRTGVCLMRMDAGLDTGPVFACTETGIGADDSAGDIHDRLAAMGGKLLVQKLDDILTGCLEANPQDDTLATYAGKIRKQDAVIDWDRPAEEIARKIRAYNPVPGASFSCGGERIKCWRAAVLDGVEGAPGIVVQADKDGIDVTCGGGALRMLEVQHPGRRRVSAAEYASQSNLVGKRLE